MRKLCGPGSLIALLALVKSPQLPRPALAAPVPVDAALWAELAFPPRRTRLPVGGGLPAGVERDDPLPPHPRYPFEPSREAFRYTLKRKPAVRDPWLRAIYDRGC